MSTGRGTRAAGRAPWVAAALACGLGVGAARTARADNPALALPTGPAVAAAPATSGTATTTGTTTSAPAPAMDGGGGGGVVTFTPRLLVQTDAVLAHHGPTAPAIEDGAAHPGLYLRRARLGGDAVTGAWRARIVVEAASQPEIAAPALPTTTGTTVGLDPIAGTIGGDAGAPRATEAFVAWSPDKAFAIAAGVLRVPLGLSRQVDEGDLRLPERARIVTRATPDHRVGVAAGGDLGLFQYALGTYAAAPRFGADVSNGGALYTGRLSAEPVGPMGIAPHLRRRDDPWAGWWRFSVGLSVFFAQLPGANEWGLGGDGQFQWRRLCVTGEALWTRRTPVDRVGFTFEPGVFVVADRVEVVARIEWFNDDVGPRSPVDAWGAALGATLFSATRHARLQAAYTLRRPAAGDDRATGWAVLRATFTL